MYQCPVCSSYSLQHDFNNAYLICKICNHSFEYSHQPTEEYYLTSPSYSRQAPLFKQYLQLLIKYLPGFTPNSIVDVGGGDSTFLDQSRFFFKSAFCILCEKSSFARCSREIVLINNVTELSKYKLGNTLYTFFQVIEHIEDLASFLSLFTFGPGDVVMLTVPCNDSIYKNLYKKYWKSFSPSHHAHLYSRASLMLSIQKIFPRSQFIHFEYCFSGNSQSSLTSRLTYLAVSLVSSISNSLRGRLKPPMYYGKNSCVLIFCPNA
jgi:hypothetical protein